MKKYTIVVFAAMLIVPSLASARGGFGIRGGVGFDPDQMVAGIQFGSSGLTGVVNIRPSVDLGLSDQVTTYSFNADVLFDLDLRGSSVAFFGGAGPTITYFDFDGPGSDWKTGISLVGGINSAFKIGRGADLEFRFGLGDTPDFRIMMTVHF